MPRRSVGAEVTRRKAGTTGRAGGGCEGVADAVAIGVHLRVGAAGGIDDLPRWSVGAEVTRRKAGATGRAGGGCRGVADAVAIGVHLRVGAAVGVHRLPWRRVGAEVVGAGDAIAVGIASVAYTVAVGVRLVGVGSVGAVVCGVGDAVAVNIRTGNDLHACRELRCVVARVRRRGRNPVTYRDYRPKAGREARVAGAVGRHRTGTDEGLALAVAAQIAGVIGEEFECEGSIGSAVQRTADRRAAGASGRVGQYGEILHIVRADVGVPGIVEGDSTGAEIDPESEVGECGIRSNGVAGAGGEEDTIAAVEGDGVGRTVGRSAHGVVARDVGNIDTMRGIPERASAIRLCTDEVSLHLVAGRATTSDVDAALVVARDDVARPGCRPADGVAGRAADDHAAGGVAQVGGAADVGADIVAF